MFKLSSACRARIARALCNSFPCRSRNLPEYSFPAVLWGRGLPFFYIKQHFFYNFTQSFLIPVMDSAGRSQHDAVLRAKSYLLSGYKHIVDMDLSKFFDRVNHDCLMSRLTTKIKDKRVLKLIRKYLTAGTINDRLHKDRGRRLKTSSFTVRNSGGALRSWDGLTGSSTIFRRTLWIWVPFSDQYGA